MIILDGGSGLTAAEAMGAPVQAARMVGCRLDGGTSSLFVRRMMPSSKPVPDVISTSSYAVSCASLSGGDATATRALSDELLAIAAREAGEAAAREASRGVRVALDRCHQCLARICRIVLWRHRHA